MQYSDEEASQWSTAGEAICPVESSARWIRMDAALGCNGPETTMEFLVEL